MIKIKNEQYGNGWVDAIGLLERGANVIIPGTHPTRRRPLLERISNFSIGSHNLGRDEIFN